MVFPSPSGPLIFSDDDDGEVNSQNITFDDSEQSGVGNRLPGNVAPNQQLVPDGFALQGNCGTNPATCQLIVFVGQQNGALGFGVSVAGFTTNAVQGSTQATESAAQNENFNTPTPSNTPTVTPTPTNTATPTNTPTPTNSPTPPPTNTPTPSRTPTPTPTVTPTPPTPIPAVASPTSPAGLLMIGGLGIAILWALRRFGRAGI